MADPRYAQLELMLPYVAEELSPEFYADDNGVPAPYTAVQVQFVEILPIYLYARWQWQWTEAWPVEGHEPPPEPEQADDDPGSQDETEDEQQSDD